MRSPKIELRHLKSEDYYALKQASTEAYAGIEGQVWNKPDLNRLLKTFPEGQICILVKGKVVACALSIIVKSRLVTKQHTYKEITGNFTFSTHTENGDVLYGIEILVHPKHRDKRLGRRLYDARKELCENLNLKSIVAGGRIPNYKRYSKQLSPREYIENVKKREISDPVLSFQLSNDFHVKKILKEYLPGDSESEDYATLLEWNNIYYQEDLKLINTEKKSVRIGIVQWQMRSFQNFENLIEQVEYFVDSLSRYKVDFILFPELFHAPLLANFNEMNESKAIRMLAKFTESLREVFSDYSIKYNTNIIAGCLPCWEHEKLYSISYLCRRDGTFDSQYKIHPTPSEVKCWGMNGGLNINTFDTDCGRIGILSGYDIEFPELARLQAQENVQILFVPFVSDSKNSYYRIRRCAQSRAIENECYVAISGCVGNLPKISNMDIQYAQSAIFTPSDFAFPTDAILAEATPNTEMTLIADLDMSLLKHVHEFGNHTNLKNRRTDLYQVLLKNKTE
ncbi:bifunctional GNAT family N-acetyltransferase/carbon-nitrogen hydrolase family protein [Ancylomarina sp. DW003]|nr:bifunctional GNAT family N-acetyltransferase/carbon-nitrogen hydrolase family protein [Ancylomarina sp. DW003]MDE5421080.1 bifunctional GNAT family N-acetyltransferase/carbon-nitrogen hydrolase family protein [Ancylomarina sp. DW003]